MTQEELHFVAGENFKIFFGFLTRKTKLSAEDMHDIKRVLATLRTEENMPIPIDSLLWSNL